MKKIVYLSLLLTFFLGHIAAIPVEIGTDSDESQEAAENEEYGYLNKALNQNTKDASIGESAAMGSQISDSVGGTFGQELEDTVGAQSEINRND